MAARLTRAATLAMAAVVAAACGVRPTGAVDAGPAPIATANPSTYALYFVTGDGGYLLPEMRDGNPSVPDGLLRQLGDGPTRRGMTTRLHGFTYNGGTPRDRDGGTYELSYVVTGRHVLSRTALGQIACTATSRPPIQAVDVVLYRSNDVVRRWPGLTCRDFGRLIIR
jgi:hypothetical protein